eukprot:1181699-Rhodomonas_salina.2
MGDTSARCGAGAHGRCSDGGWRCISVRAGYAVSGTDKVYGATRWRTSSTAMPQVACAVRVRKRCVVSGTDIAYGAARTRQSGAPCWAGL